MDSIYVMSVEYAHVDKIQRNDTVDLWHARRGHVSYQKLGILMNKSFSMDFLNVKFEKILFAQDDIMEKRISCHLKSQSSKPKHHSS